MPDMPPAPPASTVDLRRSVHEEACRFAQIVEPHRGLLWRHCRWLTGDPFEAEDLVQDTLLRAFGALSRRFQEPPAPRAWLLRIATNRWIDRCRARKEEPLADLADQADARSAPPQADPIEVEEAAGFLLALPPRERVAVALMDGLGFTAGEAAACLVASEGAVRAALHRGRVRLRTLRTSLERPVAFPRKRPAPNRALLASFCDAFNARDLEALKRLLLPGCEVEVVGMVEESGRDQVTGGSLAHTLSEEGEPRAETVDDDGETLVLITYQVPERGRVVRDVVRFVTSDGAIAAYRHFFFCPEVLAEVGARLDRPVLGNGYRP